MRLIRFPLAALLAGAVLSALATAQDWKGTQGRFEGRVLDPDGKPIEGATVKLELPGRGGTTLKTDKKGKWAIGGVAAGRWNVDIEAAGFQKKQTYLMLQSELTRIPPMETRLDRAVDPGPSEEVMAALKNADAAFEAQRYPEARALYEKALADPKVAAQDAARKALHLRIARSLSQEGQYEKELEHLQAVLDMDPADSQIMSLMAQEAIKGGMLEKGLGLLAKLDETSVKDPAIYFNVGVLLLNQQKQTEAIQYFTKAVAVDPAYVDGYFQRGLAYLGQQKMAEAKADFQKVIELAPGTPQADTAKAALGQIK
jgi:tetratricopeptide (TPR) repeat protein